MDHRQLETVIVGGAGKTGKRVAQRLSARGVPVRLASRSSARPFDWNDERTWPAALRGAQALYLTYFPDLAAPGAAERIGTASRLAAESGVERIVLLSGRGEHQVWLSERAMRDAGVPFTIVRCAFFAQNFSEGHLLEPILHGELTLPGGNVSEPFVDVEDVADVVSAALTDARHQGQIYDLTGPRLLTFSEVCAEITRASGRAVSYRSVSRDAYAAALAQVMPAEDVPFIVDLFVHVLDGHNSLLTDGVQRALGRPPRDFSAYAQGAAAAGAWKS
ncbi:MAG TPA: NmrA family NAD(P)-binding protein [Polyangiaceae bacterium]